jgi:hypothetical protein
MRASLTVPAILAIAACSSSSSSPGPTVTDTGSGSVDTGSGGTDTATTDDTGGGGGDTTLPDGTSGGDTWTSFAHDFFVKYCTECHDATDSVTGDFAVQSNVTAKASIIRCGVAVTKQSGCGADPAPKQFPICDATCANPKPTDEERTRIVAWIDAGMP